MFVGSGTQFKAGDLYKVHLVENEDELEALKTSNERVCVLANVDRLSESIGQGVDAESLQCLGYKPYQEG